MKGQRVRIAGRLPPLCATTISSFTILYKCDTIMASHGGRVKRISGVWREALRGDKQQASAKGTATNSKAVVQHWRSKDATKKPARLAERLIVTAQVAYKKATTRQSALRHGQILAQKMAQMQNVVQILVQNDLQNSVQSFVQKAVVK